MQSRVYETVEHLSACLSHHLTAAAACGRFAAGDGGGHQAPSSSGATARCSAANASSVTLTGDVGS